MELLWSCLFYECRLLTDLFEVLFYLLEEKRDMRSVDKRMADGQCNGHDSSSFAHDSLSGIHQRIIQRMSDFLLRIGYRGEIKLRRSTQQDHIEFSFFVDSFVCSVWIAIIRNGSDNVLRFLIESFEIGMIRNAYRIKCFTWYSDRGDDIYGIVVDDLPVFIPAIAKLLDLIGARKIAYR